jgi:FkbM family methyltransferase
MVTSYAQNFEDVILWRALGHVPKGLYVDVGAQHPVIDSVSKAFYEHGWRGIHVEPTAEYASLLRQDRPDETVLQVALTATPGTLKFYEFPDTGLSTGDAEIAERHRDRGFPVREVIVACITLADVFAQIGDREIHWLKIDVEGLEKMVLSGWAKSIARPWVVIVESTLPLTQVESYQAWEPLLLKRGYSRVYYDGLNRYYLSDHHPELLPSFGSGPNVFDGFSLNGTANAPFCTLVNTRLAALEEKYHQETTRLIQVHAERQAQADLAAGRTVEQLHAVESEFQRVSRALAEETRNRAERESELLQQHAKLQEALAQQIHAGHEEIWRLEKERSERELSLTQKAATESTEFRREIEASLRSLLEREREFAQQLLLVRQDADFEKAALLRTNTERERVLHQQLHANQTDLAVLRQEVAAREKAIVERDQEFARQLIQVQGEAEHDRVARDQAHADAIRVQTRAHAEREQGLLQQMHAGHEKLRRLTEDMTAREKALIDRVTAKDREIDAMLRTLAQRDQEFRQQLYADQEDHRRLTQDAVAREKGLVEAHTEMLQGLTNIQAEREQALLQQLEASQDELRKFVQEAALRERIQAQQANQSRENLEAALRASARREAEFGEQSLRNRQSASAREEALVAQQGALESKIASLESATQALRQAQELQRAEHSMELAAKQSELRHLAQTKGDLEANLHAKIRFEQQTILRLHGELGAHQWEIKTIRTTLSWRLTAPLRSLAVLFGRPPLRSLALDAAVQDASQTPDDSPSTNVASLPNLEAYDMSLSIASLVSGGIIPAKSLDELLSYHGSAFLRCSYETLLGREIDSEGARFYAKRLSSGISKIQIMAEIALSEEGKKHATLMSGLDAAIRRYRWQKVPVFGFLLKLLTGPSDNSPTRMQLRVIENQLFKLSEETQRYFNKFDKTLTKFSEEAQVRSNQIVQSLNQMRGDFDARPAHSSHDAIENQASIAANLIVPEVAPVPVVEVAPIPADGFCEGEAMRGLTSSARDIYFQLTSAVSIHGREAT